MHRATVVWRSLDRSVIDVLGQVLQVPIDPAFGKRLVSSADDLHVLLRHRLLPQPGGFEGIGWLREEPDVNDFASLHPLDYAKRDVEVDAAGSPASPEPADAHDLLSGVSHLVDLEAHVFKVFRHLAEKPVQPIVTPIGLALQLSAQG